VCVVVACPSVRPSVSLSQAGIVSKRLDESSWFLACGLPSTYPTLCCKDIWISSKISILASGTLSRTPDLEKFAAASRSRCQQLVVIDSPVCRQHLYDNRRVVAVYYKSVNCSILTPLLRFVVDLLYNVFSTADEILNSIARGAVRLR